MIDEGNRTGVEQRFVQAAAAGEWLHLESGNAREDDPAGGAAWGRRRTIRAELLVQLLTGDHKSARSVRLTGARITGRVYLGYTSVNVPFLLQDCYFDDPISFIRSDAAVIQLIGCHVPEIDASDLRTSRDVVLIGLRTSFVKLVGARIGGDLNLDAAALTGRQGVALMADQMHVEHSLFCRQGFTADGQVRLPGARIGGQLAVDHAIVTCADGLALVCSDLVVDRDMTGQHLTVHGETWLQGSRIGGDLNLRGGKLTNPGGRALNAAQLVVGRSMSCAAGFSAEGQVLLAGAQIGGQLDLSAARLTNPQAVAMEATGLRVEQDLWCRDGFVAQGQVSLASAQIGSQFDLSGATLINSSGRALQASGLVVSEAMLAENGFSAEGEVCLLGARIGATLQWRGARLSNPGGRALDATQLTVERSMLCTDGFQAEGELWFECASIGGWLNFQGARLVNPEGCALWADQIVVKQSLHCSDGFTASGTVRLNGAHIGSQLNFAGAVLDNPQGRALAAERVTVEQDVFLRDGFTATGQVGLKLANINGVLDLEQARFTGFDGWSIDLSHARAAVLLVAPDQCRDGAVDLRYAQVEVFHDDLAGEPVEFALRGFVYRRLGNHAVDVRTRLRWVKRNQDGYTPQVYDQLAAVYRESGDENSARKVAVAKQWHRRRELHPAGKAWNWLLYITVGYGYRAWQAALWLAGLAAIGSWIFGHATMSPSIAAPPAFNRLAYTLDVLLPIVDLGQEKAWHPGGAAQYGVWGLTVIGWILATALVAGLSNILKRD